jgi:hypothetical protein
MFDYRFLDYSNIIFTTIDQLGPTVQCMLFIDESQFTDPSHLRIGLKDMAFWP